MSTGQKHFLPRSFLRFVFQFLPRSFLRFIFQRPSLHTAARGPPTTYIKQNQKQKKKKAKHRDQHTGNSDTPRCDVINSLREFVQSLIPTSLQFPSLWASCGCTFLALIQKDAPRHPALSPHSPLRPIGPDLRPPGSSGSLSSHTGPGSKSLCEGRSPWEARSILPVSPRTRFRQHPQPAPSSSPESC